MARFLFVGDIVGSGGRAAVNAFVPRLREEYGCCFCVVNGENMAAGNGFARSCVKEMEKAQVDVFTSGDHTWDQKEWVTAIEEFPNVLRPANFAEGQPGRGYGIFETSKGLKIGVLNLIGRTFVGAASNCPFAAAERLVEEMRKVTPVIIVDFHAEATSEKIAMGRYLDGKVTAVLGTHTHVPTADEQVFPGGTAFQCDTGMVGARRSILGREVEAVVGKFRSGMPARFPVAEGGIRLNGAVVTFDEATGRATAIERVVRDMDRDLEGRI